jgi:ribosomal protein S18 acetylase RimI-like enzyme
LILRDATPEDGARLEDIRVRAWFDAYAGKAEQDVFDALSLGEFGGVEQWREVIESRTPITSVRAVEDDGGLTGFCAVAAPTRDDDEPEGVAEIVALYIDPDAQRRGYGRALIDDAIARLTAAGWKEVTVWTLEDNFRSLPLYESRGFKLDGSVRTESGWFVADVRLRVSLQQEPRSHPRSS